jgi:hypothetical protein
VFRNKVTEIVWYILAQVRSLRTATSMVSGVPPQADSGVRYPEEPEKE